MQISSLLAYFTIVIITSELLTHFSILSSFLLLNLMLDINISFTILFAYLHFLSKSFFNPIFADILHMFYFIIAD